MALISSVPLVPSRTPATGPQGSTPPPVTAIPTTALAVQPVSAASNPAAWQALPGLHPSPTAFASQPFIAVDGIPFIQDEAVLADDIIRPDPLPEPQPVESAATKPQTILPQTVAPQIIVPAQDPHRTAQATPWPESLRILRAPAPTDPQTG